MVYDKQDRLVGTQDAELNAKGQWLYTQYDRFGRVVITGLATGGDRSVEQVLADGSNNMTRTNFVVFNRQEIDVYYDPGVTYPNASKWVTLLSVNYYDTYPGYSFNPALPANTTDMTVLTDTSSADGRSTKGLPLMSLVKNIEDDNWTKSYTYYDTKGRAVGSHSINHLGGFTRTESKLDFAGLPLQTTTSHLRKAGETGIIVKERFVYDSGNRVLQHYHQVDNNAEVLLSDNTYNELSQLTNKKVGNNLQSIDYAYNIRGWMTDINKDQMSLTDLGGKLFSYKIKYTQKEGISNPDQALFTDKNVLPRYNGNIAEVDWRTVETLGVNPSLTPKRYGYAYDKLNRLTAGYYQNPNNSYSKENTESLTYDVNGNITNLYRTSVMENGSNTATVIDNLIYDYTGNQAIRIKDNSGNNTGYEGTAGLPIAYDANGNMTSMQDKQISEIKYNYLNLPQEMSIDFGPAGTVINIMYRADGTKLEKTSVNSVAGYNTVTTTTEKRDYLDGFQYYRKEIITSGGDPGGGIEMMTERAMEPQAFSLENNAFFAPPAKTPDLQFFPTAEGFYDYTKDQYIYQYKDHLGNVRVSYARNTQSQAIELTDVNDYYPFGMNHLKTGNAFFGVGTYKNYKYNGKELQETGMYDYGARMYMPDLGRWGVVDPLAEKMRSYSTYNYAFNNPVMFIDPDGREGLGWIKDKRTNEVSWDNNINSKKELSLSDKASTHTYVSDSDDPTAYTLPNGSGTLYMNSWEEYDIGNGLGGPSINMEFVPNNEKAQSGWFQTYTSNVPDYNGKESGNVVSVKEERLDGTGSQGSKDVKKAEYFDTPKSNTLTDIPTRESVQGSDVNWNARSSMIINGKKSFSVTWGFTIKNENTIKYSPPKITNKITIFHENAIKNLPKK
ncbi:RHS repeat-associated core domain-containing protein [Chryseobacterium viscerum]|uniref:RHS repeat-associated core domain-containing protein n=2 Tax=Chryseobacterium viscerum TaxID=1037377 RepID=A0A5N4BWP9_9FLAO|nr:RHS repeat-associated core domain-containing protein [Chryseobacterium viscerum]